MNKVSIFTNKLKKILLQNIRQAINGCEKQNYYGMNYLILLTDRWTKHVIGTVTMYNVYNNGDYNVLYVLLYYSVFI